MFTFVRHVPCCSSIWRNIELASGRPPWARLQRLREQHISKNEQKQMTTTPEPTSPAADHEPELRQSLIDIAVDSWRFSKLFSRALEKLDATEAQRFSSQLRYFTKRLDENLDSAGMRLVNLEGQPFEPGMAASPLNIADFGPNDQLYVDQMVEPILMGRDGVIKTGTILVKQVA